MITVNSLSGGKTSSYIAANYPADYDVFALVRIEHQASKFPDKKIRKEVEDRIQAPFIATAEDDMIIYTMFDLEQYIGRKITCVTGKTFDKHIYNNNGNVPNLMRRSCTIDLKLRPMFNWWLKTINRVCEMRIGFRANEIRRKINQDKRLNKNGFLEMNHTFEKTKNGKNKWTQVEWQKPIYPLINDNLYKDQIESYWKDKNVRFAPINNCVGCFHQNKLLLRKRFDWHPNKMDWFKSKEGNDNIIRRTDKNKKNINIWRAGQDKLTYKDVHNAFKQLSIFDINETDFNECDSGYCGI